MQTNPYFHPAVGHAHSHHMFGPVCALTEPTYTFYKQDELRRRVVSRNTGIGVISNEEENQWDHASDAT
jgi:hypothetical protein